MRKFEITGLKDMWADYTSAIKSTKIDFKKARIYQAKEKKENGLEMLVTEVQTGAQKRVLVIFPDKLRDIINRAGCFYEIDGCRYIPSREVNSRTLNDYSRMLEEKKAKEEPITITHFSSLSEMKELARRLRKMDELVGIHYKPIVMRKKTYARLVGLKSTCSTGQITGIDIAEGLCEVWPEMCFESGYMEQKKKSPSMNFKFYCVLPGKRKDGIPMCVLIQDTVAGRKCLRVDIVARVNDREYVLNGMELSHRTKLSRKEIIEDIQERIQSCYECNINLQITKDEIVNHVLENNLVPKKAQQKFLDYMNSPYDDNVTPLLRAYDVTKTGIFNLKKKRHASSGYDGGKRRYEVELGRTLMS